MQQALRGTEGGAETNIEIEGCRAGRLLADRWFDSIALMAQRQDESVGEWTSPQGGSGTKRTRDGFNPSELTVLVVEDDPVCLQSCKSIAPRAPPSFCASFRASFHPSIRLTTNTPQASAYCRELIRTFTASTPARKPSA